MHLSPHNVVKLVVSHLILFSAALSAQQRSPLATLPDSPHPNLVLGAQLGDGSAQQSSSQQIQQTDPNQNTHTPDTRSQSDRELKQQESQRMLGVVPAFNSVISGHAAPLTPKQKFTLYLHSATDPFVFVVTGLDAGYEQATDQFPEYRYGAAGYGKRYGAALADDLDGNFWGNAVLPALLHQDPRYFRLGHGTIVHRILYSAATTVICKGDNGKWQPSYSNIAGNFIGGAISNVYYPPSDRGISLTMERGATVTAEGALGALALEFYPDVAGWWHNRHSKTAQPQASVP